MVCAGRCQVSGSCFAIPCCLPRARKATTATAAAGSDRTSSRCHNGFAVAACLVIMMFRAVADSVTEETKTETKTEVKTIDPKIALNTALLKAATEDNLARVIELLNDGADPNC